MKLGVKFTNAPAQHSQEGLRGLDPPLSETVIANEQAALDAAICTLEAVTDMGGNAFVVLLCSFFESQRFRACWVQP